MIMGNFGPYLALSVRDHETRPFLSVIMNSLGHHLALSVPDHEEGPIRAFQDDGGPGMLHAGGPGCQ